MAAHHIYVHRKRREGRKRRRDRKRERRPRCEYKCLERVTKQRWGKIWQITDCISRAGGGVARPPHLAPGRFVSRRSLETCTRDALGPGARAGTRAGRTQGVRPEQRIVENDNEQDGRMIHAYGGTPARGPGQRGPERISKRRDTRTEPRQRVHPPLPPFPTGD
ncbi:hypothetical protein BC628DRAFT_494254 [Trametes gibbosa]|nr:hypothetical protein BC628DRAFT_494254 [Trametes gibbosa]